MKINSEQLLNNLKNKLGGVYFVFGPELLLVEENVSQIKNVAKKNGFEYGEIFEINGNFDWGIIIGKVSSLSLFSQKNIIECRLEASKIKDKDKKAISEIIKKLTSDTLFIISADNLTLAQQKNNWFKELEKQAIVVQNYRIENNNLQGWITSRMNILGLEPNIDVVKSIAFYTQGNLLATMQELQKLKIIYPDGKINTQDYLAQIAENSKYNNYGLVDAALSGDINQTLKIYSILESETSMPIMVVNLLYKEIQTIISMAIDLKTIKTIEQVLVNYGVWSKKKPIISRALKNHPYQNLQKMLLKLGRIERSIKGMDNLIVVDELRDLLLNLAGKKNEFNR